LKMAAKLDWKISSHHRCWCSCALQLQYNTKTWSVLYINNNVSASLLYFAFFSSFIFLSRQVFFTSSETHLQQYVASSSDIVVFDHSCFQCSEWGTNYSRQKMGLNRFEGGSIWLILSQQPEHQQLSNSSSTSLSSSDAYPTCSSENCPDGQRARPLTQCWRPSHQFVELAQIECASSDCIFPSAVGNGAKCILCQQSWYPREYNDKGKRVKYCRGHGLFGPQFARCYGNSRNPSTCCCESKLCEKIGYSHDGMFRLPQDPVKCEDALRILGVDRDRRRDMVKNPRAYKVAPWHYSPTPPSEKCARRLLEYS
jgi:hypothetical protein